MCCESGGDPGWRIGGIGRAGSISYVVEALRSVPERPSKLAWAPGVAIQYADIGGTKVRYVKTVPVYWRPIEVGGTNVKVS